MDLFRKHARWYFLLALFLVNLLIWYAIFSEPRNGILTVAFLDVGQGDAVFIEAPNGNQVLIDGGPNRSVLKALSEVMPFYDRSIDMVVATHPDKDHIGGLPAVFDRYDVSFFLESGVTAETGVYTELMERVENEELTNRFLTRRGMTFFLDESVYLEILFPDRDVSGLNPNEASIVAKLVYGNTSFLLTGDAPEKIEKFITSLDKENLDVDVLKVGHHGSKTSTGESLLGYSSPEYAVISLGKNNRYGHPHEDVLEKLSRFNVNIFRTDELGSIIFTTDGETLERR